MVKDKIYSILRLSTPSAERRMSFDGADVGQELPAAFAFGVGADFDGGRRGLPLDQEKS